MAQTKGQEQKAATPEMVQTEAQPQISVRVYPVENRGNTLAYADVNISGFVTKGIRIMDGAKGEFLSMPARQKQSGEYEDTFFPVTKQARETLISAVMQAYHQAMQQQNQPQKTEGMQMG